MKFNKILCVDLEATCFKDNIFPEGEQQEIIEIGVAVLDLKTWKIEDNLGILIKPSVGYVSEFCTELTSLTYEQLKREGCANYEQGINRLNNLYGPKQKMWVSWGNYDKWAIERECKRKEVKYPFGSTHFNVKDLYAGVKGLKRGLGLGDAMNKESLPKEGRAHRGYIDARWTAQILREIMKGEIKR